LTEDKIKVSATVHTQVDWKSSLMDAFKKDRKPITATDRIILDSFMGDKEYDKMYAARTAAANNERGFEGCVNKGKKYGCTFDGFYLAEYSKEGECRKCERKSHPERFHGCLFCRSPDTLKWTCGGCDDGFSEWMHKTFKIIKHKDDVFRHGVFLIQSGSIKAGCPNEIQSYPPDFKHSSYGGWRGFVSDYKDGQYTFTIPKFTDKQISAVLKPYTWDNVAFVLLECLKELGISVYDTIQIKSTSASVSPSNAAATTTSAADHKANTLTIEPTQT